MIKKGMKAGCLMMCLGAYAAQMDAAVVDIQTAAKVAAHVMQTEVSNLQTEEQTGDAAYYVFTGKDGRGFAIIAADDAVRPVIGYSATARIDQMPDNLKSWLGNKQEEVALARKQHLMPNDQTKALWQSAQVKTNESVVLLQTAEWGQSAPFSDECPRSFGQRCLSGCVATAYAILMKYYEYPAMGRGTTLQYKGESGINVASRNLEHAYQWEEMPLSYKEGSTEAQRKAVAELMADIGASLQLDYGRYATVGTPAHFGLLQNFDYNIGLYRMHEGMDDQEWAEMLRKELDNEHPLIYRSETADGSEGHVYIVDGYDSEGMFHINWGWDGDYNGYFALDNLHPGMELSYGQWVETGYLPMPMDTEAPVATVDGKGYSSLLTAMAVADMEDEPLTLTADCKSGLVRIPTEAKVEMDLNGHSIDASVTTVVNGELVIDDTQGGGQMELTTGNNGLFSVYGKLSILNGVYRNTSTTSPEDTYNDYRRVIWSGEGSEVYIADGGFEIKWASDQDPDSHLLCLNGEAMIDGGTFWQGSNNAVISNYCTTGALTINGGTFRNTYRENGPALNYRRVIWTDSNTKTVINKGTFITDCGSQALLFKGDAEIDSAYVRAGNGSDCLASGGNVSIQRSTFAGQNGLYDYNGSGSIKVRSGLFAYEVEPNYLAENSECVAIEPTDEEARLCYEVIDHNEDDAITIVRQDRQTETEDMYDLIGNRVNNDCGGFRIMKGRKEVRPLE